MNIRKLLTFKRLLENYPCMKISAKSFAQKYPFVVTNYEQRAGYITVNEQISRHSALLYQAPACLYNNFLI
jgi:hypothetical protein